MRHWLVGLLLLLPPPAFAQQAVPSIAFDSVPDPLRLPPNMYFGEVSGVSLAPHRISVSFRSLPAVKVKAAVA